MILAVYVSELLSATEFIYHTLGCQKKERKKDQ